MSNLRNIKDRITSIKSTQKITRAMKMIAATKVKKAENAVKMSRPFTRELFKMFVKTFDAIGNTHCDPIKTQRGLDNYPALLEHREIKTLGLVVMSSNKGLAGAYSANIVRFTLKKIKKALSEGKKVKLYLAGQKAYPAIKNAKHLDFEIRDIYSKIMENPSAESSLILAEDLANDYVQEKIDAIELITTRYVNMMSYKVEEWTLLPAIEAKDFAKARKDQIKKFHREEFDQEHQISAQINEEELKVDPLTDFEPGVGAVLQKIVPMYLTNVIYQALLEANASELASRMTAMSAATNNAQEMITNLTVEYNKVRQANITQELTEVISGADALK